MTTRPESEPGINMQMRKLENKNGLKNDKMYTLSTGDKSGIIGMDIDAENRQSWKKFQNYEQLKIKIVNW